MSAFAAAVGLCLGEEAQDSSHHTWMPPMPRMGWENGQRLLVGWGIEIEPGWAKHGTMVMRFEERACVLNFW